MEEYDFEIVYIKGKDNVVSDALSRISIDELRAHALHVHAVTRSMSNKYDEEIHRESSGQGTNTPTVVQVVKAPKYKHWIIINHNETFKSGIKIVSDSQTKEKLVYINWSHLQEEIQALVKEVGMFLEKERLNEMVVITSKLTLKFIAEFKSI